MADLEDEEESLFSDAVDRFWIEPHSPLCIAILNEDCERIELLGEFRANPYAVYMKGTPNDEPALEDIAKHGFDWSNLTLAHPEVLQSYLNTKAAYRK